MKYLEQNGFKYTKSYGERLCLVLCVCITIGQLTVEDKKFQGFVGPLILKIVRSTTPITYHLYILENLHVKYCIYSVKRHSIYYLSVKNQYGSYSNVAGTQYSILKIHCDTNQV